MKHPPQSRSFALDFVRGISALVVLLGHLKNALFVDYDQVQARNIFLKSFYFVSGMGHQAVIVFFVLSGYFVGGSVLKSGKNFKFSDYIITRLSRLWTVLIPSLLITALADSSLIIKNPNIFHEQSIIDWHSSPNPLEYSLSFSTALKNILFLQTIKAPTFGTNGPLWSLANEAWYYALFPCLYSCFLKRNTTPQKILFAILSIIIVLFIPRTMLYLFTVWLMGASIHFFRPNTYIKSRAFGILSAIIFLISLILIRFKNTEHQENIAFDIILGVSFTIFCLHLHSNQNTSNQNPIKIVIFHFSEMSFSLYAIHMPLLYLSYHFLSGIKVQPNLQGISLFSAILLILILISWIFWWIFERNTPIIRNKIRTLLQLITK